jgi:formate--tetrahydrofolate ligase
MSDIEIAKNSKMKKINEITDKLGIPEEYVENYGKYKAKISIKYLDEINKEEHFKEDGKLILVTSINPTPLGEGKTTASIGLCDGLNKLQKKVAILALREPSMGPVFGIKGGATGGGYSQVVPMEDINLHFTGDIHAITSANNLLSAIIDNHIYFGNELDIQNVTWKRCVDLNDRELRKVEVGLSGEKRMKSRVDGFDISVASEIMAILCLSTSINDLKRRLGNIIIGYNSKNQPVTCRDLKAEGSLAVILKDAINPNIVQTLENNPAIIHGGPFANIAHGCNSILATKMAMKLGDYVVTEAGFGADLGAEKFLNIKCRKFGISPDCVVIVATIRALKYHGGASKENVAFEDINSLKNGIKNLKKHIENIKSFGLNPIVAINKFNADTEKEIQVLKDELNGVCEFSLLESWGKGSDGALDLASKVIKVCEMPHTFKNTYSLDDSIKTKIEKVAKNIYGADGVDYSEEAEKQISFLEKLNETECKFSSELNEMVNPTKVPICIAKTQYSFSDDEKNLLCDHPFKIHVTSVEFKAGAEFIVVKTGKIMTMPGLPKNPAAENIDLDENGNVEGIF